VVAAALATWTEQLGGQPDPALEVLVAPHAADADTDVGVRLGRGRQVTVVAVQVDGREAGEQRHHALALTVRRQRRQQVQGRQVTAPGSHRHAAGPDHRLGQVRRGVVAEVGHGRRAVPVTEHVRRLDAEHA
jgi:hypothetical protein